MIKPSLRHIETRQGPTPVGAGLWAGLHIAALSVLLAFATERVRASAETPTDPATAAIEAFASHCFSPFVTAARVEERLMSPNQRVEFYDLDPFSNAAPSPANGRAATAGTDRRCEVSFDGHHIAEGIRGVEMALAAERILEPADVPAAFTAQTDSAFVAARRLNPRRIAVVQVGVRPGPSGPETFLNVERLVPSPEEGS